MIVARRRRLLHRYRASESDACPSGAPAPRRAFTLLETMLVLALVVAIGALAWPALRKPFAAQRLKKSADQLHADLTRARAMAIRTGTVRQLKFDPVAALPGSGAGYVVAPATDPMAAAPATLTPTAGGVPSGVGVEAHSLPEGITVVAVEAFDDVAPPPYAADLAPAANQSAGAEATGPAASGASIPSATVFFHPDGTTSSAQFTLANEQGLYLRLELRGLTGAVTTSDLLTAEQLSPTEQQP